MNKIRKGDNVIINTGKDKGKNGIVLSLIDDKSWYDYTEFDGIVCADSYQDEG